MEREIHIEIPIGRRERIVFLRDAVELKKQRLRYAEITGIAFLLSRIRRSVNLIPTGNSTTLDLKLHTRTEEVSAKATMNGAFWISTRRMKEMEEAFTAIVSLLENLVLPFTLTNLLLDFVSTGELRVQSVAVQRHGISCKRMLLPRRHLRWTEYGGASVQNGTVRLHSERWRGGKDHAVCTLSMKTENAVVLPAIVNYLAKREGVLSQEDISELRQVQNDPDRLLDDIWSHAALLDESE